METERCPLLNAPKQPVDATRKNFALLITGIWSLTFISGVDGTIVATLISSIGSSFESMQLSSWIGTAYLLSLCGFTPLYGRLANLFGRRASILLAGTVFGVGTVLCGFAANISQLIAFRALAGIGGGGMTVVGSVIISDTIPLRSRALHQGFIGLVFSLGAALGAPLGGWLGDTIGWRSAFSFQAPFLIFGLLSLYLTVQEPESSMNVVSTYRSTSIFARLKRIDYAGSGSLVLGLLTFLVAMHFKSTVLYGWGHPRVWTFLAASAAFACLFILIELKFALEPVMPINILKLRTPGFVVLNQFLLFVLAFSTMYNAPLYFTAARLRTSTDAGMHLIPNSVGTAIGALFTGWYMRRTGCYWWLQVFGCMSLVVANILLASWDMDTPEWVLYTTLVPAGLGCSVMATTTLLAIIASVPHDAIPLANGLFYLFRIMGQVLGVSLPAGLTQGLLAHDLRSRIIGPGSNEIIAKILASTEYIHTLPPDLREKASGSWLRALHVVFCCQIALAAAVLLSALPIEEHVLPDMLDDLAKPTEVDAAPRLD